MRAQPCIFPLVLIAAAANAQTIGMNNWIHATADLDTTVQFYRDVFGLDQPAPARPPNPAVPALLNVPGAKLRVQILRFPGATFGFELTNFGNEIEVHPGRPQQSDPGAARLIVSGPDAARLREAIKKAGAPIVTETNEYILARDPDGYLVQVLESPKPGLAMGLTVANMQSTFKFYGEMLGFDMEYDPPLARAVIPGTRAEMRFYEFKGPKSSPFRHQVPDPGTPALALRVKDLDGLLARLKAVGTPVISKDGMPVQFSPTIRNIFVEDPSGFKVELYEQNQ